MKRFHQLPQPYRNISIGVISALSIVAAGFFVLAVFPKPNPVNSSDGNSPDSETTLKVTPVNPSGTYTPPPAPAADPAPSAANPSTTDPAATPTNPNSPISPEAITGSGDIPVTNAEPYDDAISVKFNHLSYPEAPPERIKSVGLFVRESYEREEFLDYEAADAFKQMRAAAAAEGIDLIPISGFRTIARQAELFDAQVEKKGSEAAAAQLSAPPGHSEHHTGYAIDIGDGAYPDADIRYAFQETPAYAWLKANAHRYGFEESFPYNNQQGVSFEPWHWRFTGSDRASNLFINSRSLFPNP